jgi:2-oxoglutarate ferredoxin oxidoreductase subunit alpha
VVEARDRLRERGIETDYLRVRGLPLAREIAAFIERHERVYVVEQNRDGQLYGILRGEVPVSAIERLRSIRHYNGVPIDAHAIVDPFLDAERPAVTA